MSKEIKFDFLLNKYINKEIENVYEQYKKTVLNSFVDSTQLIEYGWQGDFAESMMRKIYNLQNELEKIGDEILSVDIELKELIRRMQIIEDESKRIANDNQEQR